MTYLTNPRRSLSHQIDETKSQTGRLFSDLQALVRIHFEELELARQGGQKYAVDGGGSSVPRRPLLARSMPGRGSSH